MLNKRIKSVLVAGLLVVGMSGNVFADTKTITSNIDELTWTTGLPTESGAPMGVPAGRYSLQNDKILIEMRDVSGMSDNLETVYEFDLDYDSDLFVIKKLKVGNVQLTGALDPEKDLNKEGGDWKRKSAKIDLDQEPTSFEVEYELVDDDGDGIPNYKDPDWKPEDGGDEPGGDDPEAGDANTMVMLGGGVALAGTALVLLNRKKEDEE